MNCGHKNMDNNKYGRNIEIHIIVFIKVYKFIDIETNS